MKFFNIQDTKAFFKRLSGCEGDVALVNRAGDELMLITEGRENMSAIASTYLSGTIAELELHFSNSKDAFYMAEYLLAM